MKQRDEQQLRQLAKVIYSLPADVRRELLASAAEHLLTEGKSDQLSLLGLGDDESNGSDEASATSEDSSLLLAPYLFAKKAVKRTGVKLINVITWVKPNPEPRQYKRRLVSSTEPVFRFVKSGEYQYHYNNFMAQRDVVRSGMKTGNNIGKKYFELVEQSDLTEEQKKLAREEIQQAIQEVKNDDIASFRMKIRGIHSEAYGGHEGGRKSHLRAA